VNRLRGDEYIAFLKNSKQLQESEVDDLFGYYLGCLRRHPSVRAYILNSDNGYEGLAKLIEAGKTENILVDLCL
jgi:hypothetical protein